MCSPKNWWLSMSWFPLKLSAMIFLLLVFSVHAQERKPQPTTEDIAKFGQLPVRFNGRVTTYDLVARNYLRRFGGRDTCCDQDDKEQPAARWLLEVMATTEARDQWRIFKIENAELLKLLELKPHAEAKASRNLFSEKELLGKLDVLAEKANALYQTTSQSERNAEERAIAELSDHIKHYQNLQLSFKPVPDISRDLAKLLLDRLGVVERDPLPLFVPSADGKDWLISLRAGLLEILAGDDIKKQNGLFRELKSLLKAHRQQDYPAFHKVLNGYSQSLKTAHVRNDAFQMAPPKVWLEMGVPPARELFFYNDANAPGHRILEMFLEGTHYSEFMVNHFPGGDISPVYLHNSCASR